MATLAPLLFCGSSSFLQVTRTTIICRMGSHFSQIQPLTVELAALECSILGSNKDSYDILDEFEF